MAELKLPLRAFLIDLLLNTAVPLACYRAARARGVAELPALLIASVYPFAAGLWGLLRSRKLNPFSIMVLIGLLVSAAALLLGGSPRVLLLRESLPTLGIGLACFATLASRRPLMFYFARHMAAGEDHEKIAQFNSGSSQPEIRAIHRQITLVWGIALTLEFCAKTAMVFLLSTARVLLFGPALFNAVMIGTMIWTIRYAKSRTRLLPSA